MPEIALRGNRVSLEVFMHCRWQKLVVLVLLALVLIDVAGACPVDDWNFPSGSSATISVQAASPSSSGAPLSDTGGLGEGCFCFCAHMILAPLQTMNVFLHSTPVDTQPLYIAVEAPLASPYHPPRS